ncbi:MAG TPA: winged helix-turn-helix domain-containing protein [Pyrinomonadaceae bacterium]|nr:PD40 domain-containing protein [Chloracidobacterium sp.]MBP9935501.1 PD40 domain-containing protein [Pyrinomonadaceae bacterium]MBK9437973.1 PD40 domain-containing protein [Chloracidobacterium sp.]MBL0242189.1 PD40 domain-containing protein [Chloracidobacterium sp.]HQX56420.1 winged helix-turn-helix domain-containing protein [Pyrinomonadaceae bacterium]
MSNEINNLYEFANFRFDAEKGKLWQDEKLILLSPKATELLKLLLEENGEFVSKEDIFDRVWADTFVEDGVLTQNIYTLRKFLGKDSNGHQLIENRTRLGYRITVPVVSSSSKNPSENNKVSAEDAGDHRLLPSVRPVSGRTRKGVVFSIGFLLLVILVGTSYKYFGSNLKSLFRKPIERVRFTSLTSSGDLTSAVISPDGALLAFERGDGLFLKDVHTEKEIQIHIPNAKAFGALQFSPDGNYIYFRNSGIISSRAAILKVSRFGGEPELIVEKAWGSFSISPDGKRIAYFLNVPPVAKFNLLVRTIETGEEVQYRAADPPENPCAVCSPAWTPDGNRLLFTINVPPTSGRLFIQNLATVEREEIKVERLQRFEQAAWLPNGESFVVSATERSKYFHLWQIFYPGGEPTPLTSGLANYKKVSISADGRSIITLKDDETSNIVLSDAKALGEPIQITSGDQNNFGQKGLAWVDEKRLLFSSSTESGLSDSLVVMNVNDKSKITIPSKKESAFRIPVSDGEFIWFAMSVNGVSQIFQMDMDGKNVAQLTETTDGQKYSPRISNDSRHLYYVINRKNDAAIMRFDLQNKSEEVFFINPDVQPGTFLELSPDNKYLTFSRRLKGEDDTSEKMMAIVSIENTDDLRFVSAQTLPGIRRFSPDSQSLDYIFAPTDGTQIVRQKLDGGEPLPIVTVKGQTIFNFAWSIDGKQLAMALGKQSRDAVLLSEFSR